jgi:hypothetical protein
MKRREPVRFDQFGIVWSTVGMEKLRRDRSLEVESLVLMKLYEIFKKKTVW